MADERERLRIEYIPLSKALEWDWEENPKAHDIGGLADSIWRYGFLDPPKYDSALDRFVYGNGRMQAVAWGREQGRELPTAVDVDRESGEWLIPVKFGCDSESAAMAKAFAVDHNNLTYMGAEGATPWDLMRMWDEKDYLALLEGLAGEDALPASVPSDDLDALLNPGIDYDELWQGMPEFEQEDAFSAISSIKVHFATEEAIEEFAEIVGQTVTKETTFIWYPKRERENLKKYVAHEP